MLLSRKAWGSRSTLGLAWALLGLLSLSLVCVALAAGTSGGTETARRLLPAEQREDALLHLDASNLLFVVFRHAGPAVVWFADPWSEDADRFEWELEELAERARIGE